MFLFGMPATLWPRCACHDVMKGNIAFPSIRQQLHLLLLKNVPFVITIG
jgi:hypothetical protein